MTVGSTPIDLGRLRRAVGRRVKRIGAARFLVEGRSEPSYLVDLESDTPCSCVDARARGRGCLHELCARLHAGDSALVYLVAEMLAAAEREARTLRVRSRARASNAA